MHRRYTLFQTHPDFIETFIDDPSICFVKQPDGVFHPKLYLFETSQDDWACLLGSANFTKGGFDSNVEACVLFTNSDDPTGAIKRSIDSLLETYWKMGRSFKPKEFEAYKKKWLLFRNRMRPIAGDFGKGKTGASILTTKTLNMSWKEYFEKVRNDKYHGFDKRITVLIEAKRLFEEYEHFSDMPNDDRLGIAGVRDSETVPWGWFGSMRVARTFPSLVNSNNRYISEALDAIPLAGEVTQDQYDRFIRTYIRAFPGGRGHGLGTATRLLAMKRPDYFVCFDSANRERLCDDFEVSIYHHDYDNYWDKVIQRILIADWWVSPRPRNRQQAQVWDGRAAFLDSIYYVPKS